MKNGRSFMEKILEQIKANIIEPMNELNIVVDSIVWEKEGNYNYLKIILDRVNGLDLDTIVEATNIINPIIDKLDLIDDEYILDISSKERGNENE
jgi:ribosome maturation factor RimP